MLCVVQFKYRQPIQLNKHIGVATTFLSRDLFKGDFLYMAKTTTKSSQKKTDKYETPETEVVVDSTEIAEDDVSKMDFTELIKQSTSEWEQGWWFMKPKWDEWALRLKLFNNQKRDKESVGDTTMFAVFQTILATLYEDQLAATFSPREIGDDEIAENLDLVADYDYDIMEKDIIDYEWDWETLFFGRGLLCTMDFDEDTLTPSPYVWNRMATVRDPEASSVAGDREGRGGSRFLYREIRMTKDQLEESGNYFNFKDIKATNAKADTKSPLDQYMRDTAEAAGLGDVQKYANVTGDNATLRLREGFTTWNGTLCFVTIADNGKKVIRYQELDRKTIPVVDRVLFPIPNTFDSPAVPDFTEDKQRARAVALNLALKGVKANLHPMYLFDKNKIDERQDFNFAFNKFIPVAGNPNGAVVPLTKDHVKADVSFIMETLAQSAERATGTPDIKQGADPDAQNTATRDALVSQGSDSRYGLAARIFGWSERRFWQEYYRHLKENMDEAIHEKMTRVVGALGAAWRPFSKKDLVVPEGNKDPNIKIESKAVADARRFNEAKLFRDYLTLAAADPTAQLRAGMRYYGKLIGMKQDLVETIYPPTIDELRAEEENQLIQDGEKAIVLPEDDHYLHLQIHNKLPDSPQKKAHLNAHKTALILQKTNPELVPQPEAQTTGLTPADQLSNPAPEGKRNLPVNA